MASVIALSIPTAMLAVALNLITFTLLRIMPVREPVALSRMAVGFVYVVLLASIVTTPLAGRAGR